MAYCCLECGHIFEDGEQAVWEETHGLDAPPYEKFSGCPICKSNYEETVRCEICHGEFLIDELNSGCVCNECLDEYKKDFDTCYSIGKQDCQEIKINGLLISLLSINGIEEILYNYLKENQDDIDCSAYVEEDEDWFVNKLVKEVNENDNR